MSGFASEPERSHEKHFAQPQSDHASLSQFPDSSRTGDISTRMERQDEHDRDNETEITGTQKMISALSGSVLTSLLVTPLDVVRVRLQSQIKPKSTPSPSGGSPSFSNLPNNLGVTTCCREVFWVTNTSPFCVAGPNPSTSTAAFTALNPAVSSSANPVMEPTPVECAADASRQKTFTSTFDGLQKIARNEGMLSLWRGLSPTLMMAIPGNIIYFAGYDGLRSNPRSPVRNYVPEVYAPLVAGATSRVAAAMVVSPIEMFRTRLQATAGKGETSVFVETLKGMGHLAQTQGYTSLWRGLTLTMWRDVPFSAIYWWGYEAVRNALTEARDQRNGLEGKSRSRLPTFTDSFIAGATSGAVASVVTTPFDVGKTRQQISEREASSSSAAKGGKRLLSPEEMSMPRFLRQIFLEEGVPGLFKGWAARCLKVAPACAIMISSYEVGKKMAQRMNERKKNNDDQSTDS